MAVYNISGHSVNSVKDIDSNDIPAAFTEKAYISYLPSTQLAQTYLGGYIELQPDSWDGTTPVTGTLVDNTDSTAWGFPMSLSSSAKTEIQNDILNGSSGIKYIRFPLGFAYRGYRNIDSETGLAKNIGERWTGQNEEIRSWMSNIVEAGGGLAPEYWCPAPYWLTSGSYSGNNNRLRAGGSYAMNVSLQSIKSSDVTQYDKQIDDFTDAIINDLEYLEENIAPVKMFGLQNEPANNGLIYGSCKWDVQTYNDVLYALCQKLNNSFPNIMIHAASSDEANPFNGIAATFVQNHSDLLWGYSHHSMRLASGEEGAGAYDYYRSEKYKSMIENKSNVFLNEYEYFSPAIRANDFKCANNMIHMINELYYGSAEVLHPIIHICKPIGQSAPSTNTDGYCLYKVDMSDGSVATNTWAYNSWKMFNDNLPIGSKVMKNFFVNENNIALVGIVKDSKYRFFMANTNINAKPISIYLPSSRTFTSKLYNLFNVGTVSAELSGVKIRVQIPANSGICLIEK